MRIAIVGVGAIGGMLAVDLIKKGIQFEAVDIDDEYRKTVNEKGLTIEGSPGKYYCKTLKINKELKGDYDIIFLVVKSYDTKKACETLGKHLKDSGVAVSLQNGINNRTIKNIAGEERFIAGVVGFGVTNHGKAHLTLTSDEKLYVVGRESGLIDKTLLKVHKILSLSGRVELSKNILGDQWGKLAMNCIINPMCAIYNKTFGECVHDKELRRKMQNILTEVLTVGQETGIKFTRLGGKVDLEKFFTIHILQDVIDIANKKQSATGKVLDLLEYPLDLFKGSIMLRLIAAHHGKIQSSMWQDLQRGNRTEIDYLNGYICELAREHNIKTPANEEMVEKVKKLETK